MFPEFIPFLSRDTMMSCTQRLPDVADAVAAQIVETLPREWEVNSDTKAYLVGFLKSRARFLAESLPSIWEAAIGASAGSV
jgi:hypothetical protein